METDQLSGMMCLLSRLVIVACTSGISVVVVGDAGSGDEAECAEDTVCLIAGGELRLEFNQRLS